MGVSFGNDADVDVGGDIVGGNQIIIEQGAWDAVAGSIAQADIGMTEKTEAIQDLSAMREELKKEEPDLGAVERFARGIKRIVPHAFTLLLTVAPELARMIPGLLTR